MYHLDTTFLAEKDSLGPYRVLHHLLSEGCDIPIFKGNNKIGKALSCTILENGEDWYDEYRVHSFLEMTALQKMSSNPKIKIKFDLDKQLNVEDGILDIRPIMINYVENGKLQFTLFKSFHVISIF